MVTQAAKNVDAASRGFIMRRFPNLAAASDDLYELVISGVENKKQMITLPLEELRKFRHPGMAQPIPHKGRISAG